MHSVKSYSAKQIPKVMKHIGTVWQTEWHDRIIRDEQEFENTWEYIRQNPVKANLCEYPGDYSFLWQLANPVVQASSLPIMQDDPVEIQNDPVEVSRQDACPTDPSLNPVVQASSLPIIEEEYDPDTDTTISRGVGKCPNCDNVIADDVIKAQFQAGQAGHQLYAVAGKYGKGGLEFRIPKTTDLEGISEAENYLNIQDLQDDLVSCGSKTDELIRYGVTTWLKLFNPRQLLTLVAYVEILNEVKEKLRLEYEPDKVEAIATYLALILDQMC